ncbi:MAG: GGDEF domain-containing protein [Oceanospirillaceae bacterium]|nr:GGDEF domain-containing protein [Oceanospirillaceae bacterium]
MTEGKGESLLNLLQMVCRGLEGQSESLDTNLTELRLHLMKSENAVSEELVKKIAQDIRILHLERQENNQDFLDVITDWLHSLNKISLSECQKTQLSELIKSIGQNDNSLYQLPARLKLLLDIQLSANQTTSQSGVSGPFKLFKKIAGELSQLLELITPSTNNSSMYESLVSQLEQGVELDNLPKIINSIASLIEAEKALKGESFNSYLQGLNQQLTEVQGFLSKTLNIEDHSAKERKVADGTIRETVVSIRNTVQQATGVEMLQRALTVQLDRIVDAVDSLKNEEFKRDENLLVNYNELKQRLSSMEQEAEKVQEYLEKERRQARLDALTGLPNRTAYNEIMAYQIEQFRRYQQPLSLVMGDLDHFKLVNDNYGHLAGDKVLTLVAKILGKGVRGADLVTRYGGEEFVMILPRTTAAQAGEVMDKIRRHICKIPFNYRGKPINISMSFGVSEAIAGDSIERLFSRADTALYKAKENGRNNVCIG